jgi:hypothetical protein
MRWRVLPVVGAMALPATTAVFRKRTDALIT